MKLRFQNILVAICGNAARHPTVWLLITLIFCIPALCGIQKLELDTNLIRLLPTHSPAAQWTRKLENVVSDGGYFTILLESDNQEQLVEIVQITAERVRRLEGVSSVEYLYPLDFIEHYRYLLIPDYFLEKILDYLISLEAEVSPFTENIMEDKAEASLKSRKDRKEMEKLLDRYSNLTKYHQREDGRVMGMFIRPESSVTDLAGLRNLLLELEKLSRKTSREFGIWSGVGGSQIDNLKEYDVIVSDLRRSGIIASAAIILVLILSFRSLKVLPVLLFPLCVGLLWAFSLVPFLLGSLNSITSFLLLVLFGMGIDYAIHLVKRFQLELTSKTPVDALTSAFISTGKSVLISGLTTALALFVLTISDFRGFSEFGFIGGWAILMMLIAMMFVMPYTLILGHRMGLVKSLKEGKTRKMLPPRFITGLLMGAVIVSIIVAATQLRFNYSFNKLEPDIRETKQFDEKNKKVYTKYMSPGALYVAPDLSRLDALLDVLRAQIGRRDSTLQRISSIRSYAPTDAQTQKRLQLIDEIKEQIEGAWIRHIDDPNVQEWIEDLKNWFPPPRQPEVDELPETLRSNLEAKDGSGRFLVGVYPNVSRGDGKNAMAFTEEIYGLEIPAGIEGPIGEMPVFAEILLIVADEGPWMVTATFLGVLFVVFCGRRSFRQTAWVMFPLISGVILTLGVMGGTGFKLNFFNVVVIPTLIGLGVDHGVHFYRRWKELDRDTVSTQRELFGPLSICTVTTMMGYSGMVFANHPGLRTIGFLACLGLSCIWLTSLILFPGILDWYYERKKRRRSKKNHPNTKP